jgi:dihydroorotase
VDRIRQGVAEGVITVLATDHAPHSADEKAQPFDQAPFGIIGLETALALYAEALVHTGAIDWPRLIALLTIEPARLCNLDRKGLGQLTPNGPADVTLIDPELSWTIGEEDLRGLSRNTPFLGRSVRGRAVGTIVDGLIRFTSGDRTPADAPR